MTQDEFNEAVQTRAHAPSLGTGRTRMKSAAEQSAEIERLTQEFLANGGQIDAIESVKVDNPWRPAFNQRFEDGGDDNP